MYTRFDKMPVRNGRETVFMKETGSCRGLFKVEIRKLVNGLLNSHGGVIYFGVTVEGIITGLRINRKEEDDYRLAVDHTIGKFLPLVSADLYRLSFLPLAERNSTDASSYKVIELKVSVGKLGDIYEDGEAKVFIMDNLALIGPLRPQELRELVLLKYKEAMEGAEEVAKFATPHLEVERARVKSKVSAPSTTLFSVSEAGESAEKPARPGEKSASNSAVVGPNTVALANLCQSSKKGVQNITRTVVKSAVKMKSTVVKPNSRPLVSYNDSGLF